MEFLLKNYTNLITYFEDVINRKVAALFWATVYDGRTIKWTNYRNKSKTSVNIMPEFCTATSTVWCSEKFSVWQSNNSALCCRSTCHHIIASSFNIISYTVGHKNVALVYNNFGKCRPIFIICKVVWQQI